MAQPVYVARFPFFVFRVITPAASDFQPSGFVQSLHGTFDAFDVNPAQVRNRFLTWKRFAGFVIGVLRDKKRDSEIHRL